MAKTIYITQEQYNKIGQYITENNNEMLYNLNVQDGESPMDAAAKAKDNIEAVGGSTVVDKTKFVIDAAKVEGKKYTKKQLKETKINQLVGNNTKYSKAEFTKNILKK